MSKSVHMTPGCINTLYTNRLFFDHIEKHSHIQRWDRGSGPPPDPENHINIGFLSNTGPDPLKITKHSMLGHHRHTSHTSLNGVSLVGR